MITSFSMFNFSPRDLLKTRHLRLATLWTCLGLGLILGVCLMSLISVPAQVKAIMVNDKITHLFVYACLMGWFGQIFRHDLMRLMLVVLLVSMGIAIEYLQGMVPSRQFEVLDMVANTSGVVLAWALTYTWMGRILEWFENSLYALAGQGPQRDFA